MLQSISSKDYERDGPANFTFVLLLGSCLQDQRPGQILVFRDYFVVFVSCNNQLLLKLISSLSSLNQDISSTTNRNMIATLRVWFFFFLICIKSQGLQIISTSRHGSQIFFLSRLHLWRKSPSMSTRACTHSQCGLRLFRHVCLH